MPAITSCPAAISRPVAARRLNRTWAADGQTLYAMPATNPDILYFRPTLPFTPSQRQVIYVEDCYNPALNRLVQRNYDALCNRFEQLGAEFCYFPYLSHKLSGRDFVRYFTPYRSEPTGRSLPSTCLTPFVKRGCTVSPSLIVYDPKRSARGYSAFRQWRLTAEREVLAAQLQACCDYLATHEQVQDTIFKCSTDLIVDDSDMPADGYADKRFPEEVEQLMEDVRNNIDRLRQYGVSEMVLNELLQPKMELSRLHISATGQITLPDYGHREIKMSPLVKAVYFLFLRHPEGIVFKSLPDYRNELYGIYSDLTGRLSNESIRQSIIDVTDPCKNSINEKCARIREAFIREFDDHLANYYYVTGNRGCAKGIRLAPEMVEWWDGCPYKRPNPRKIQIFINPNTQHHDF